MRTGLIRIVFFLLLQPCFMHAEDPAEVSYRNGDFLAAYKSYSELLQKGHPHADIFYNLGNCAYRLDSLGPAIAFYYKALTMDPGHEDAQFNLALASSKTRDHIAEIPESLPKKILRRIVFIGGRNQWAWLSVLFCAMSFSILFFRRMTVFNSGSLWVILFLINFVFCVFSFSMAMGRRSLEGPGARLVIREAAVNVKSAPSRAGSDLFILHEGTVGELLEEKNNWLLIKLSNGNKGWLQSDAVIRI